MTQRLGATLALLGALLPCWASSSAFAAGAQPAEAAPVVPAAASPEQDRLDGAAETASSVAEGGEPAAVSSEGPVAPLAGPPEPPRGGLFPVLFSPPDPTPLQYDWIRLVSGEWLKGEIELMRSDRLEFESDELDSLKLDWENVAEVRTIRTHTYLFEGRKVVAGVGHIDPSTVSIKTEQGETVEVDRKLLLAIIPGQPSELNYWRARASLGVTLRAGNTEQAEFSGSLNLRREDTLTRGELDYNGTVGTLNDERNANTHRGNLSFDIFLSRRLFVTPVTFEVFSDEFANIAYRLSPGMAIGYDLVDRSYLEWEVSLGAGYQFTQFRSVQAGQAESSDIGVMVFSTTAETEITERVDFDLSYTLRLGVPDVKETSQNALAVLSVEMTKLLDLDVSFTWDRLESPTEDADGVTPKKDDFRLVLGLAVEY